MSLEERLDAVERALTDEEVEPASLSDAATVERRLQELEARSDRLETRLADAEAAVDAVRGRNGSERQADRDTERTAERALATAREVERRLDEETPPPRPKPVVREARDEPGLLDRLRSWW